MKTEKLVMICLMCIASFAIQAQKVIKIGIIGLDTSHSSLFYYGIVRKGGLCHVGN